MDYEWGTLDASGVVTLKYIGDTERDVVLRRARIGDIKRFGLELEAADDLLRAFEEELRAAVGIDDEAKKLLGALRESTDDTPEAMLKAPDLLKMQANYEGGLQRFLLGDANPYPPIYAGILREMGDATEEEVENLPAWCLGQMPVTLIVIHWQQAPLVRGMQPGQDQGTTGNRASRRAGVRTPRR